MDQARAPAPAPGPGPGPGPGELLLVLREQASLDLAALVPADGGESASTFLATGRDGTVSVLKIGPGADGDSIGRLRELVTGLRRRATRRRGCSHPGRWTAGHSGCRNGCPAPSSTGSRAGCFPRCSG